MSANSRVLDSVASSLKPFGVEVVPFNGVLAPARFNAAFAGDRTALQTMAGASRLDALPSYTSTSQPPPVWNMAVRSTIFLSLAPRQHYA
ncbi:hypothetical protein MASR2M48_28360 [Spirochaetota bacterium]